MHYIINENSSVKLTAVRDVIAYIWLKLNDNNKLESPSKKHINEADIVQKEIELVPTQKDKMLQCVVTDGYHGVFLPYKDRHTLYDFMSKIENHKGPPLHQKYFNEGYGLYTCYIPKGSKYYINEQELTFVSSNLILLENYPFKTQKYAKTKIRKTPKMKRVETYKIWIFLLVVIAGITIMLFA
jgi:hypothetical protein